MYTTRRQRTGLRISKIWVQGTPLTYHLTTQCFRQLCDYKLQNRYRICISRGSFLIKNSLYQWNHRLSLKLNYTNTYKHTTLFSFPFSPFCLSIHPSTFLLLPLLFFSLLLPPFPLVLNHILPSKEQTG